MKNLLQSFISRTALAFSCAALMGTGTLTAATLAVTEMSATAVYGYPVGGNPIAGYNPNRTGKEIRTRRNANNSQYSATSFVKITLPELGAVRLDQVSLFLKTASITEPENSSASVVIGFTDDPFNPAVLNATTYDGTNPWTLGHNAGIDAGRTNPPFPNVLAVVSNPSTLDTWYEFTSPEMLAYLQQQIDAGKEDLYLYVSQGKAGIAGAVIYFHGPNTETANAAPYLAITYTAVPEPGVSTLIGSAGVLLLTARLRRRSR